MKFSFIITFLCIFNAVFAQKGIFIEPTGGLFMPFSQNQKNTQFLKKGTYTSFNLGISLRYQTNDKWHFLLGYYFGLGTSTNFSFKDKAETLNQEYSYLEGVAMNQIRVLANRKYTRFTP